MDKDLELLHQKIDFLTEQVLETQRRQQALEELWKDLTPVMTDLFNTAVQELDEISPYFGYEDLIHLLKKVLRNIRSLTALFEHIESAQDFVRDMTPLSKEIFDDVLQRLDALEEKGYFTFMKAAFGVFDNIVTNYSEEDVRLLGENITSILDTVKEATQPEVMRSIRNAVAIYRDIEVEIPDKMSTFALIKQMLDPEVRRSLGTGLSILKKVSENLEKYSNNTE
ncbi:DUF1641 domain-containing protein [candidate division KSB1 bacterium]|nr:DUF1641 domain-containing protein [candidate division KSB1 bacterium]